MVAAGDGWQTDEVDLSTYAGQVVRLRLVWLGTTVGNEEASWRVSGLAVVEAPPDASATPLPTATLTDTPLPTEATDTSTVEVSPTITATPVPTEAATPTDAPTAEPSPEATTEPEVVEAGGG